MWSFKHAEAAVSYDLFGKCPAGIGRSAVDPQTISAISHNKWSNLLRVTCWRARTTEVSWGYSSIKATYKIRLVTGECSRWDENWGAAMKNQTICAPFSTDLEISTNLIDVPCFVLERCGTHRVRVNRLTSVKTAGWYLLCLVFFSK